MFDRTLELPKIELFYYFSCRPSFHVKMHLAMHIKFCSICDFLFDRT